MLLVISNFMLFISTLNLSLWNLAKLGSTENLPILFSFFFLFCFLSWTDSSGLGALFNWKVTRYKVSSLVLSIKNALVIKQLFYTCLVKQTFPSHGTTWLPENSPTYLSVTPHSYVSLSCCLYLVSIKDYQELPLKINLKRKKKYFNPPPYKDLTVGFFFFGYFIKIYLSSVFFLVYNFVTISDNLSFKQIIIALN